MYKVLKHSHPNQEVLKKFWFLIWSDSGKWVKSRTFQHACSYIIRLHKCSVSVYLLLNNSYFCRNCKLTNLAG